MKRKLLYFGLFCHPSRIEHDRNKMYCYKRKHYCHKCWKYINEQRSGRKALYDYIKRQAYVHYPIAIMRKDIKKPEIKEAIIPITKTLYNLLHNQYSVRECTLKAKALENQITGELVNENIGILPKNQNDFITNIKNILK